MLRRLGIAGLVALLLLGVAQQSTAGKNKKKNVAKLVDIAVVTGYADTETSPRGFVDLNGATSTVVAAEGGIIVVRFSSETKCSGTKAGYCSIRILVDGQEANPIDAQGTYFDATGAGGMQTRTIERSMHSLTKGSHDVVVQWGLFGGSDNKFKLGAWHLTIESFRDAK